MEYVFILIFFTGVRITCSVLDNVSIIFITASEYPRWKIIVYFFTITKSSQYKIYLPKCKIIRISSYLLTSNLVVQKWYVYFGTFRFWFMIELLVQNFRNHFQIIFDTSRIRARQWSWRRGRQPSYYWKGLICPHQSVLIELKISFISSRKIWYLIDLNWISIMFIWSIFLLDLISKDVFLTTWKKTVLLNYYFKFWRRFMIWTYHPKYLFLFIECLDGHCNYDADENRSWANSMRSKLPSRKHLTHNRRLPRLMKHT